MSTTIAGVDARAYLTGWLSAVTDMTVKDINAMSDEQWNETHGGVTKPCGSMIGDVITNLTWTAETIANGSSEAYNGMQSACGECSDKSVAISRLQDASAALADAVKNADDDTLNQTVMAPWNMPTPLMVLAHISVSHIWYHDGQLNYVQAVNGDEKVHWL